MDLAAYLIHAGLTMAEFGRRIERSEATVSRIARKKQRPDFDTLQRMINVSDGAITSADYFAHPELPRAEAEDAA